MNRVRNRRHFTAEQKAQAVRRHLIGKESVSDLADELGVQPSRIHQWVKQLFDRADKEFLHPVSRAWMPSAASWLARSVESNSMMVPT